MHAILRAKDKDAMLALLEDSIPRYMISMHLLRFFQLKYEKKPVGIMDESVVLTRVLDDCIRGGIKNGSQVDFVDWLVAMGARVTEAHVNTTNCSDHPTYRRHVQNFLKRELNWLDAEKARKQVKTPAEEKQRQDKFLAMCIMMM
jgi:hypothetical protein